MNNENSDMKNFDYERWLKLFCSPRKKTRGERFLKFLIKITKRFIFIFFTALVTLFLAAFFEDYAASILFFGGFNFGLVFNFIFGER